MKISAYSKKSFTFRLIMLARGLEKGLSDELRVHELNIAEALSLVGIHFESGEEIYLTKLAGIFGFKKSHISHAIAKLEEQQYLKRYIHKEDKRRYYFILTEKAKKSVPKLMKTFDRFDDKMEFLLGPSGKIELEKIFKKLT